MTDDPLELLRECGQDIWAIVMDHTIDHMATDDEQFFKEADALVIFCNCLNRAGVEVVNPFKMKLDD